MSESTNPAQTPASVTGRRRRFTGAHPYPALPQSRLPLLRGVLWIVWAAVLATLDTIRDVVRGGRRLRTPVAAAPKSAGTRAPRVPSLTPTG